MPLYRNLDTNIVDDLPEYVIGTPLGARYEPYTPDEELYEEDKVVDETAISTQRLSFTATPIVPTDLKDQANAL